MGNTNEEQGEKATSQLNQKHGNSKALFQPCDVRKKEDMESWYLEINPCEYKQEIDFFYRTLQMHHAKVW